MKILSIIDNHYGSAYYRQLVPMRAVREAGYPVTILDSPLAPSHTLMVHDVIQTLRIASHDSSPAISQIQQVQRFGKRVVVDYDDDLINIPAHNPAATAVTSTEVIRAIQVVDAITVTTEALAAVYRPYAKRIAVIPNYVDVKHWPESCPTSDNKLTIGLVGSASHHEDWRQIAEPMRRIRENYPDVAFLVAGHLPDYLSDIVTEFVPWQSIEAYQRTVNRINIGLCPLADDPWNKRKTFIKALELGMAGAAVVASPILYRDIIQGRGTLARGDWYSAISEYITNAEKRNRDAKALHDYVVSRWDVSKHTSEIYNTYRKLFTGVISGNRQHQRDRRTGWAGH